MMSKSKTSLTWIMKSFSSSTSQIQRTSSWSPVSRAPEATLKGGVVMSKSPPKSSSLHPQLSVDQSLMLSSSTEVGKINVFYQGDMTCNDLAWYLTNAIKIKMHGSISILSVYKNVQFRVTKQAIAAEDSSGFNQPSMKIRFLSDSFILRVLTCYWAERLETVPIAGVMQIESKIIRWLNPSEWKNGWESKPYTFTPKESHTRPHTPSKRYPPSTWICSEWLYPSLLGKASGLWLCEGGDLSGKFNLDWSPNTEMSIFSSLPV